VRIHTPEQIRELYKSVKMFGQIRPVVIDENGLILAGNGLVQACRENGETEIAAYRMTGLSEAKKKKLMIADNRTYGLGLDDNTNVMQLLKELGDFDVPGYEEDLLRELLADDFDDVVNDVAVRDYGVLNEEEIQVIQQSGVRKEAMILER
jgi:ParB-like chromosome segregation protein Spo0J